MNSPTRAAQIARFAAVGGLSTGLFMLGQYVLIGMFALAVTVGTTLSFAIGVATSYFGHHAITFQRSGSHLRYGPRFVFATAVMLAVSNILAYEMVQVERVDYLWASAAISIVYPIGSFFLQSFWVFAARRNGA